MICSNCGSSRLVWMLAGEESDDMDDYWCSTCDCFADPGSPWLRPLYHLRYRLRLIFLYLFYKV